MTVHILRGDARKLPLADGTVDLIVTSPPYWSLRSYTDGGEHYDGQIGAEDTPQEFIGNLIDCTREWVRVLKPTGSIFVNLGDKYNSAASGQNGTGATTLDPERGTKMYTGARGAITKAVRPKSLLLLPERYRIACVDELGLIARAVICWSKPNGLPESVTDRVRRSHEDWVHLVKQPRYYSAIDHIRTPHVREWSPGTNGGKARRSLGGTMAGLADAAANPLGALPGSVWEVATEPLIVPKHLGIDHYAAYPTALIKPIILGWSPSGICTACGEGRRPVVERTRPEPKRRPGMYRPDDNGRDGRFGLSGQEVNAFKLANPDRITGEVCACPDTTAPTRPALILDPFGGTGTTALVGNALGRDAVSVDMSADYCRLARWRTSDPGQIAKAMGVPKPPAQLAGQTDLLTELDGGAA